MSNKHLENAEMKVKNILKVGNLSTFLTADNIIIFNTTLVR